jgi:glycosyl transferase family 25
MAHRRRGQARAEALLLFWLAVAAESVATSSAPSVHRAFDHFGAIFLINLPQRVDRLSDVSLTLHSLNVTNATVIRAIPHPCGAMGCTLSHVLAMQQCLEAGVPSCLVLEDDFAVRDGNYGTALAAVDVFFKAAATLPLHWDVLMLSANLIHSHSTQFDWLRRVDEAQTTSGYAVTRRYARTLLRNFLAGAVRLNNRCPADELSVDAYWKPLQKKAKWYVLQPTVGYQRASFSDIEGEVKDYGV